MRRIAYFESFALGFLVSVLLFASSGIVIGIILDNLRQTIGTMMAAALFVNALMLISAWVWFASPVPTEKANDDNEQN